ncbi:hypothetical protein FJ420_32360 [Mesorhizobium sp. B3-1-3]|uniref:hypothetical protein n=1 Tax=unclassified Mesorhizobium TaxID=325217 RepID=UPI00112A43FD|nr:MULTISPECIES: hypothetical protein [unclassified Mesorhizobium]TPI52669.1 hypothetical protein FJ424_32750 [Mesorhizobium sp. B3-1-8]TPI59666.1 hypothetical protein FJ420_32360 [Mesorhizobium sp. B3-1-3]
MVSAVFKGTDYSGQPPLALAGELPLAYAGQRVLGLPKLADELDLTTKRIVMITNHMTPRAGIPVMSETGLF